jgi:hypothetical protein
MLLQVNIAKARQCALARYVDCNLIKPTRPFTGVNVIMVAPDRSRGYVEHRPGQEWLPGRDLVIRVMQPDKDALRETLSL